MRVIKKVFTDDIVVYLENPKESIGSMWVGAIKIWESIRLLNKTSNHKNQ